MIGSSKAPNMVWLMNSGRQHDMTREAPTSRSKDDTLDCSVTVGTQKGSFAAHCHTCSLLPG